jgi:L-ribulose-5-phosphate 3-epimerase
LFVHIKRRNFSLRLSIVTDEISEDFKHALQVCRDLQVDTVELRKIDGKNIAFHDAASLARIKALLQDGGFRVCSIASPFLKCPLWDELLSSTDDAHLVSNAQTQEWEILQRSFELAKFFNAPLVRTFSFMRIDDPTQVRTAILQVITEAVRRTEDAGLKLVIENEHACNIATGEETGWLLQHISTDAFGVIWDPGNEAVMGSLAFPTGYQHVRGRVLHMHVKDVNRQLENAPSQEHFVKVGSGSIDYVGQFRALVADGFDGTVSLETHYIHPSGGRKRATRESFAALRTILQDAQVQLT